MKSLNNIKKTHHYLLLCGLRTVTVVSYSFVLTPPNVEFHANHPFVMMILSRAGDVLFHGRLSKP